MDRCPAQVFDGPLPYVLNVALQLKKENLRRGIVQSSSAAAELKGERLSSPRTRLGRARPAAAVASSCP